MEICVVIDIFVNVFNLLIMTLFTVQMYVELTETRLRRKFLLYGVGFLLGMSCFIYDAGRVIILWLY